MGVATHVEVNESQEIAKRGLHPLTAGRLGTPSTHSRGSAPHGTVPALAAETAQGSMLAQAKDQKVVAWLISSS